MVVSGNDLSAPQTILRQSAAPGIYIVQWFHQSQNTPLRLRGVLHRLPWVNICGHSEQLIGANWFHRPATRMRKTATPKEFSSAQKIHLYKKFQTRAQPEIRLEFPSRMAMSTYTRKRNPYTLK
ncbi:hypothetical protein TNCV_3487441 [Trichonephila clavipes]|nr:hypothetical protein TNCV_3487441 [Trichonephila clavipes]